MTDAKTGKNSAPDFKRSNRSRVLRAHVPMQGLRSVLSRVEDPWPFMQEDRRGGTCKERRAARYSRAVANRRPRLSLGRELRRAEDPGAIRLQTGRSIGLSLLAGDHDGRLIFARLDAA